MLTLRRARAHTHTHIRCPCRNHKRAVIIDLVPPPSPFQVSEEYCTPMSLLASTCSIDTGMGSMSGCANYNVLCKGTSAVRSPSCDGMIFLGRLRKGEGGGRGMGRK